MCSWRALKFAEEFGRLVSSKVPKIWLTMQLEARILANRQYCKYERTAFGAVNRRGAIGYFFNHTQQWQLC